MHIFILQDKKKYDNDFKATEAWIEYFQQLTQDLQQLRADLTLDLECGKGNLTMCQNGTQPDDHDINEIQARLDEEEQETEEAQRLVRCTNHNL